MDKSRISIERDFYYRQNLLQQLRNIVSNNKAAICKALQKDLGKSFFEAYGAEVSSVLEEIDFALENLKNWMSPQKVKTPLKLMPGSSWLQSEPMGRVLIISPWNYPFQLLFSPLVSAIAAGNQVVLKPSEISQNTEAIIFDLISKNFKAEDIDVVLGGPEKTQELLNEKWDFIFYTGNSHVGKIVMRAAAEHLTPICLELGGKSPCIVDKAANIEVAAKRIAWGKFFNAGQTCVAPDYLYVHESVYEPLINKIKESLQQFYKNSFESNDFGKVINVKHFERLSDLMTGSKIIWGGKSDIGKLKIEPTLIEGDWDHISMKAEIFGPILPIFKFSKSEDVIDKIAKLDKPLALYVFSENQDHAQKYMNAISFGGGCINDCILHLASPELPFGGVGHSGMGSYHGKFGFDVFSHKKGILKHSTSFDPAIRYPPYQDKIKGWMRFFIK